MNECIGHLLGGGWMENGESIPPIVAARRPDAQPPRCTKTAPACTRAGKHATRTAGLLTLAPEVTSQRHACQGHATTVPSRSPSPSGPPRWLHVLSMA